MDAVNIALPFGGAMPGLAGTGVPVMSDIPSDAGSFGAVLGGLMNGSMEIQDNAANELIGGMSLASAMESRTVVGDTLIPAVTDAVTGMDIASAAERNFTLSPGAENALMNFIGSYFKAAAKVSDSTGTEDEGDIMSEWQEMLSNLGSSEISQLSAFSSELETALFSGSRYGLDDDDITWTAGDVFIDVLGNRTKKKNDNGSEMGMMIAQTLAASGYTGFNFSELVNIGTTGDLMGTYSDRTVKNITASAMKSVFGGEYTGTQDLFSHAQDLFSHAELMRPSRPENELNDLPAVSEELLSEETVTLIRNSSDETVENFSHLLSDTVKEHIEENGIKVETVPAESTHKAAAEEIAERPPVQNIPHEAVIRKNNSPRSEEDIPRIRISQDIPDSEKVSDRTDNALPEKIIPQQLNGMQPVQDRQDEDIFEADITEEISHSVNVQTAEAVLERISSNSRTGASELTVRLDPRSLGEITVRIVKEQSGDVSVTLAAHNPETAKLLSEHSGELIRMLSDGSDARTDVIVVDPAQAGQYAQFDMGGSNSFYFGQGGSHGGRSSGGKTSAESVETVSSAEETDDQEYISEEARLWTTA